MRDIVPDKFLHIFLNLKKNYTKLTCWRFLLRDPVDFFCALVCCLSSFLWVFFVCDYLVLVLLVIGTFCLSVPGFCSPSLSIPAPSSPLCVYSLVFSLLVDGSFWFSMPGCLPSLSKSSPSSPLCVCVCVCWLVMYFCRDGIFLQIRKISFLPCCELICLQHLHYHLSCLTVSRTQVVRPECVIDSVGKSWNSAVVEIFQN